MKHQQQTFRVNPEHGKLVIELETIVRWDGLAKVAEKYLKKGSLVYVEGKLKTEEWEKDGIKRYTTRIRVTTMNMMDRASNNSSETPSPQNQESNQTIAKQNEDAIESIIDGGDDDLPF